MNPTTEELRVITELWIETFGTDAERASHEQRRAIGITMKMVLRASGMDRYHPFDDCWLAARAMLLAFRAGRGARDRRRHEPG